MEKTRKELVAEQIELFTQIQLSGINIVTCGECGTILIHKVDDKEEIPCFGCLEMMDKSDCPDFWWQHGENSQMYAETKRDFTILSSRLTTGLLPSIAKVAFKNGASGIEGYVNMLLEQEANPDSRLVIQENLGPELFNILLTFKS